MELLKASFVLQSSQFIKIEGVPRAVRPQEIFFADGNCLSLRPNGACAYLPSKMNSERSGVKYEDSGIEPM